jgi:polysaccharide biosynthesis/export protein
VRVTAEGDLSLPLVGNVHASGLTCTELQGVLESALRKKYMTDPQVSVVVKEMDSHPVSVLGAVQKPGIYQISTARSLVEVLSMAQGLADDAGDTVIVMRHGEPASSAAADYSDPSSAAASGAPKNSAKHGPLQYAGEMASSTVIVTDLKNLIDSGDPRYNVMVYPGDMVKVPRAGIVYVVGEVKQPGGFVLRNHEGISVLQALALAQGLTRTSAAKHARIIRTDRASGVRSEIPIDLNRILAGAAPDPLLRPRDIVFIPNSATKAALYRGTEAALSVVGGLAVYRW